MVICTGSMIGRRHSKYKISLFITECIRDAVSSGVLETSKFYSLGAPKWPNYQNEPEFDLPSTSGLATPSDGASENPNTICS